MTVLRINRNNTAALIMALGSMLLLACSDDTSSNFVDGGKITDSGADSNKGGPDQKLTPDLGALPDLGQKTPCESEWRTAISPQLNVTTGKVTTTTGATNKTLVDATAGGMNGASKNPFVYISLKDGKRVDIDDYAAKKSTAWDLAIRRTVIRVNGGDSGPGKGAVAILSGKKLADITKVPDSSAFATDDFLSTACAIKRNPINNIWTAIGGSTGMWYDYSSGAHAVQPKKQAYVIRTAAGDHVKLTIDSYYNASNVSAMYTLSWSALK